MRLCPCISALPELALVAQMYKDKLCVVSVNIEPVDDWREALKKHSIGTTGMTARAELEYMTVIVPTAVAFHSLYLSPQTDIS